MSPPGGEESEGSVKWLLLKRETSGRDKILKIKLKL